MSDSLLPLAPTRMRQKRGAASKNKVWSEAEDAKLIRIVNSITMNKSPMTPINWFNVASFFPNKTQTQVTDRWVKVLDPTLVKGSWSREEDEKIIDFVQENGPKHWAKLASMLPGRLGKQVRERWVNHLDPNVNRGPWTPEEDEIIIDLHQKHGNHWTYISTHLPTRSDNAIKNRWNSTLSKRFEYQTKNSKSAQNKSNNLNKNNIQPSSPNYHASVKFQQNSGIPPLVQKAPIQMQPFSPLQSISPFPPQQQLNQFLLPPNQIHSQNILVNQLSPQNVTSGQLTTQNQFFSPPNAVGGKTVQIELDSSQSELPYRLSPQQLPITSPAPTPIKSNQKNKLALPSISILVQSQSDLSASLNISPDLNNKKDISSSSPSLHPIEFNRFPSMLLAPLTSEVKPPTLDPHTGLMNLILH
ncbi:Myb-like DNA-binding domain containing protein [Tritrichomonas foetus]|uniref:Myb-like DNA-binding domain containing protein n=1 Tax=Tritrichomonas foetus TaxID=1144522 RepID=A0A1J4K7W5_9EUKA|nr:Myb-like DNA-binding domain containing protein [Tritrichomonas foetus]|eukprot:OHT05782.1 Myb-like DNA-binding domain containing protein [Tritrichomonas foetus]